MKTLARSIFFSLALSSGLGACNLGQRPRPGVTTIQAMRDRAHNSSSFTARRDLALGELVAPGGSLLEAERAVLALSQQRPDDVRLRFAEAVLSIQHGDFERATRALAGAIDGARRSEDRLAPSIAEASVTKLLSLRGDVNNFDEVFRPLVERVRQDPGHLGAAATVELLESAVRWARERGDAEAQTRWVEAAHCVTRWTVAGPFGPLPNLRFDDHFAPEGTSPLARSHDLGPGRGHRPTYTVRARGCAANLGHGVTLTGVLYAATDVTIERETDAVLYVESPNAFTVLVDGLAVATVDPRRRAVGSAVHVPLRLAEGRHTLRVKVASSFHSPLLLAALTDPSGHPLGRFDDARSAAHPVAPAVLESAVSPADDAYLPAAQTPRDPFARYALAELAFSRRHPVAGRELLRPLATGESPTPTTLIAWGSVALADPFVPSAQARDRARRAFERAGQLDARAYFTSLQLARLASEDERSDEALAMVRAAHQRHPENPEVVADLADRLLQRNWDGEAQALLTPARRRWAGACWPTRMLLTLAQRHGDGELERSLASDLHRCDALTESEATVLGRMRRWAEAEREFERLLADDPEGRGLRRSLAELARARGDHAEALRRSRALLEEMPEDDSLRGDIADLEVAAGRSEAARELLNRELSRRPGELSGLYRLRAFLAGREDLEPWRQDGRRVLRDFAASGRSYDAAAVLVLDYTVRRSYPDGSALELTHNIVRVQSQEGVEAYGEFTPPANSTVLGVRTLKADGRALEPEQVAGKESLSFPELRPGDAIEFEYTRVLSPSEAAPGGFASDRFYFRGFEVPYDRSEYVIVVPRAMELRVDPRGPLPELNRTERGGLVEYRWVARQSNRMTPEPHSVAAREFIPSVAAGYGASWDRFVDALRERLSDLDAVDPEAVALAREIAGRARRPSQRLLRLHHWVQENIAQEGAGTPFDSAPRMLAARAGHRTRVLCYLLNLSGVPCDLALVRQGSADSTRSELADEETYQSILLRVRTEQGERWVTAADNNAPVGYVPPATAGGEALVLAAGAPRATVPALDLDAHGRFVSVRLTLQPDGNGRAVVEERLRGYAATGARAVMRRLDAANRDRQFEAYVGGLVAGASLASLEVEGTEDVESDLVFRYAFTAPGIATRAGDRLDFEGLFHAGAARTWAELPRRTVPLWNADPVNAHLDLTVTLPQGAAVDALPSAEEGRAPGTSWSLRWTRVDGGFRVERRARIPTGRVSPADYEAFAASLHAFDEADTRRVSVRLR